MSIDQLPTTESAGDLTLLSSSKNLFVKPTSSPNLCEPQFTIENMSTDTSTSTSFGTSETNNVEPWPVLVGSDVEYTTKTFLEQEDCYLTTVPSFSKEVQIVSDFQFTRPSLSPNADPYVPTLYPPGKDKFGRTVITSDQAEMLLDYYDDVPDHHTSPEPPATPDIINVKQLDTQLVRLSEGKDFVDRILPPPAIKLEQNTRFKPTYFINLHYKVRSAGTYNYAGARIPLEHCKIDVKKFRELLTEYDDIGVLQYLEFGFPLGLAQDFELDSCIQNHSSASEYFSYIDNFFVKEPVLQGVTGPWKEPPFQSTKVSPLMTAIKKPGSRRPVFDATYGDMSINNNTPEKEYLGEPYLFTFPTVLDLADVIIKLGPGCLLWKRDLSRWFMQLPVDPCDYDKYVWM